MGSYLWSPYLPPAIDPQPLTVAEQIRQQLGEEGMEGARHAYRAQGVRRFAAFVVHAVHKKVGLAASEALYARVALYGNEIPGVPISMIPEFESMRGFERVAKELFEEESKPLPAHLLYGGAPMRGGWEPEPDR